MSTAGAQARLGAATLLTVVAGCADGFTQLVAVVDSDYEPVTTLKYVEIQSGAIDSQPPPPTRLRVTTAPPGERGTVDVALPFSFGIRPRGSDPERRVEIRVRAFETLVDAERGDYLVQQVVRTGFREGKRLRLEMFLACECEQVRCQQGETCERGMCRSVEVDPSELDVTAPGEELEGFEPAGTSPACGST